MGFCSGSCRAEDDQPAVANLTATARSAVLVPQQAAAQAGRRLGGKSVSQQVRNAIDLSAACPDGEPNEPEVKKEIIRALHRNADLEASHVDIEVTNGRVRLDGTVKAFYERDLIKNAAWSAPGVTAVEDHLRIG